MTYTPKVSVLVPVYNAAMYLERCVDSILSQTLKDFELIIIDDGSTDESPAIIDSYAEKDGRIRCVHNENQGVCRTREYAVSIARGEYLKFVDSDDYIEPSMLEVMTERADSSSADMVLCGFTAVTPEGEVVVLPKEDLLSSILSGDYAVVWRALIRRCVITDNDIHFPIGINYGEDYVFMCHTALCCNNVVPVSEALYNYNQCNASSLMSSSSADKIFAQIRATKEVETILEQKKMKPQFSKELTERKLWSKGPLAPLDWEQWLQVFPEVNELAIKPQKGKKAFIRRSLQKLADKF